MKKKVLVVDDEEGIRFLYKEELEEEGCDVVLASNGEEALKALDSDSDIDLVLLDIKMPGMDGVEVLRRIKEKKKDIPVILSTAYPHYKHEFGTWACDAYVVKSSDLTELKEIIKEVLAKDG
ncbi:MAG: response regulator [Proteobacteria bacterium]|nr:response regulator [Pseudomonadota bacterium]